MLSAAQIFINFCVTCTIAFQISANLCLQSTTSGYSFGVSLGRLGGETPTDIYIFDLLDEANATVNSNFQVDLITKRGGLTLKIARCRSTRIRIKARIYKQCMLI